MFTIDLTTNKVEFQLPQTIDFDTILSRYYRQLGKEPGSLSREEELDAIQRIADKYDETADFGWDDMYLDEAVGEVLSEAGIDPTYDDDDYDDEDDGEEEDDDGDFDDEEDNPGEVDVNIRFNPLDEDDKAEKPKQEAVEYVFTCPLCGNHRIAKLERGVFDHPVTAFRDGTVVADDEHWDSRPFVATEVLGFECKECGWIIPAKTDEELIEFLKEYGDDDDR